MKNGSIFSSAFFKYAQLTTRIHHLLHKVWKLRKINIFAFPLVEVSEKITIVGQWKKTHFNSQSKKKSKWSRHDAV